MEPRQQGHEEKRGDPELRRDFMMVLFMYFDPTSRRTPHMSTGVNAAASNPPRTFCCVSMSLIYGYLHELGGPGAKHLMSF